MRWFLPVLFLTSTLGAFQLFAVGTFGVMPIEAWMTLLFAWLPLYFLWHGEPVRIPLTPEMGLSVAVWGIVLVSCIAPLFTADSEQVRQSIKTFAHFSFIWFFFMLLVCMRPNPEVWRRALRWYAAATLIIVPYGLYQLPARAFDLPLAWLSVTNVSFKAKMDQSLEIGQLALQFANFFRVTSIFSEPSGLAAYVGIILAIVMVPVVRRGNGVFKRSWVSSAVIIMCALALLTAFSLTGIMLAGVVLILVGFLFPRMITGRMVTYVAIGAALVVVADQVINAYFEVSVLQLFAMRIESIVTGKALAKEAGSLVGESLTQRTGDYEASYIVWMESPFLGVGPGNFAFSQYGRTYNQPYPSALYGSLLAEQGALGLGLVVAFFCTLIVVSLRLFLRWNNRPDLHDQHPAVDALASIAPFLAAIIMFVSFTGNMFVHAFLWLEIAVVMVTTTVVRHTLGELRTYDLYLVRRPWRELAVNGGKGAQTHPKDRTA